MLHRRGIVVGAFKPDAWLPATIENFPDMEEDMPGRYGFVGREIPDSKSLRSRVRDEYRARGAANPVRFIKPLAYVSRLSTGALSDRYRERTRIRERAMKSYLMAALISTQAAIALASNRDQAILDRIAGSISKTGPSCHGGFYSAKAIGFFADGALLDFDFGPGITYRVRMRLARTVEPEHVVSNRREWEERSTAALAAKIGDRSISICFDTVYDHHSAFFYVGNESVNQWMIQSGYLKRRPQKNCDVDCEF